MRVVVGVELEAAENERLQRQFPDLDFIFAPTAEELLPALSTADVLFGGHPKAAHIHAGPHLKWFQSYSAGINRFPLEEMKSRSIVLTSASGAHAIQISENILAMMFAFAIAIPDYVRWQQAHEWRSRGYDAPKFEIDGSTLLIAGLGGIGAGLALKAKGLGMRVLGVRNRPLPPPQGVDEIIPRELLPDGLKRADHVALCLPLTEETTGFLGEQELRAMKPTAYVYNVGRGQSIEREALLTALREGWIAGAGLDVTDPEPLPPDDPLWSFPNVILTQHTSGSSPQLDRRVTNIFVDNLRRFFQGEPLENVVDFERGY